MNERFYGSAGEGQRSPHHTSCGEHPSGMSGRMKLLKKIQEYNFMMIEAGLFLDNQPCCEAAQTAFCKYREMYLELLAEYEEHYGPLTYSGINVRRDGWSWVNSPWPWELEDC